MFFVMIACAEPDGSTGDTGETATTSPAAETCSWDLQAIEIPFQTIEFCSAGRDDNGASCCPEGTEVAGWRLGPYHQDAWTTGDAVECVEPRTGDQADLCKGYPPILIDHCTWERDTVIINVMADDGRLDVVQRPGCPDGFRSPESATEDDQATCIEQGCPA